MSSAAPVRICALALDVYRRSNLFAVEMVIVCALLGLLASAGGGKDPRSFIGLGGVIAATSSVVFSILLLRRMTQYHAPAIVSLLGRRRPLMRGLLAAVVVSRLPLIAVLIVGYPLIGHESVLSPLTLVAAFAGVAVGTALAASTALSLTQPFGSRLTWIAVIGVIAIAALPAHPAGLLGLLAIPASAAWTVVRPVLVAGDALTSGQWSPAAWQSMAMTAIYVLILLIAAERHVERVDLESA